MLVVLVLILLNPLLVLLHETGHFMMARFCGVQVNELSIGMGKSIYKVLIGSTFLNLKLFPYGAQIGITVPNENPTIKRRINFKIAIGGPLMDFLVLVASFILYLSIFDKIPFVNFNLNKFMVQIWSLNITKYRIELILYSVMCGNFIDLLNLLPIKSFDGSRLFCKSSTWIFCPSNSQKP